MAENVTLRNTNGTTPLYPQTSVNNIFDMPNWVKSDSKPSYNMNDVGINLEVISITGNVNSTCNITGAVNAGKSQTIIYVNDSGSSKVITIPNTYRTPNGSEIIIDVANGGYCEVNYLNVGGIVYARAL